MQITKQLCGETVELKVEGRVDSYWADHLAAAVDQEIRQGSHHIQLDLSQVAFLSSAGIGTLVRLYKDLKSIQGSFAVSNCSRNAESYPAVEAGRCACREGTAGIIANR